MTFQPSSRGATFSREERSDVAGRGDPEMVVERALDCRASLAMTERVAMTFQPSSRGAAFSREERSDVAGRGDPEMVFVQTLDCRASLAMTEEKGQ
jgi:hypothetical protein